MPKKTPLSQSVLLALGLSTGCQQCGSAHIGPCLSPPIDEVTPCLSPPEDTAVGPCLSETPEPHVGPCLEPVPEPRPELTPCLSPVPEPVPEPVPAPVPAPQPADGASGQHEPDDAVRRVLARGVLPDDVAALLRRG